MDTHIDTAVVEICRALQAREKQQVAVGT